MFSKLMQHHRSLLTLGALALGLSTGLPTAHAELRRVEQSILGMDCAPCAYGMQKGLSNLEGVTDVKVSLNESRATLELAPGNQISLRDIREVVANGGFKPSEAKVNVVGTVQRQEEKLILKAGDELTFTLAPVEKAQEAWDRLREWPEGEEVLVKGQVVQNEQRDRLSVRKVSEAPKPTESQEQQEQSEGA